MEPHEEMTEADFQEMMAARETAWSVTEFRLDPRYDQDQGEENE